MARVKCRSCGGVYETEQDRNTEYYHACPPVELVTVDRAGALVEVERKDVTLSDVERGSRLAPRPGGRDENVRVVGFDKNGSAVTERKADGAGTQPAGR